VLICSQRGSFGLPGTAQFIGHLKGQFQFECRIFSLKAKDLDIIVFVVGAYVLGIVSGILFVMLLVQLS
jgi:hypothetical protein